MTYENPGVAPEPARSRRRPVILVTGIVLAVLVMAIGALVAVNNFTGQQKTESLSALKGDHLNALGDARGKVQPAANAYLAAYKKARNAPASRDQAMKDSQKEKDEFQQASNSARSALQELKSGHDSADTPVGVAVQQLVESHQDYFDYMDGLVESYPQFEGLFRDDEAARCNGLFVGSKASTLRERQTLLAQAAEPCRKAASDLLQSKNNAYVEFARTFDNKVAELQERAEVTAKGEENYTEFVRLKDDLVKRAADAEARNAPEAEVQKIADDAKAVNARIRANRSEFDFAAKRYLAGVKDMPSTVENVFAKEISADIKHFDSVIPTREQILKDTIDVELTAK